MVDRENMLEAVAENRFYPLRDSPLAHQREAYCMIAWVVRHSIEGSWRNMSFSRVVWQGQGCKGKKLEKRVGKGGAGETNTNK